MRTFADAMTELERVSPTAPQELPGGWTWAQVLEHCAQSIECSIEGFPKLKPGFVRATIGRLVARRFLGRGTMSHDVAAPIPGLDVPEASDLDSAMGRLQTAIDRFNGMDGEPAPHFILGNLTKSEFERIHVMHIADHIRSLSISQRSA